MRVLKSIVLVVIVATSVPSRLRADEHQFDAAFSREIRPFVESYCVKCHNSAKAKGDLDLSSFQDVKSILADDKRWELVMARLKAGEMPPENAKKQPADKERRAVIAWIESLRDFEANRNAGDPGPVLARRLSNAEYDNTIRDLTGVDIRPTREFPVDPANEAGFDNSGESLQMSPALLKKYLEAARHVTEYLILTPRGIVFAPYPVINDTDRDKFCVNRIVQFYRRQPVDYAEYFFAAWLHQNRAAGKGAPSLDDIAREQNISPRYLGTIWTMLNKPGAKIGPTAALLAMWDRLPADSNQTAEARRQCGQMSDLVRAVRGAVKVDVRNRHVKGYSDGSQPLVLWKDREMAALRMKYPGGALMKDLAGLAPTAESRAALMAPTEQNDRDQYEAEFKQFCAIFPDAFFISERSRIYLDPKENKGQTGRLLSAGFHSQEGYFRDDGPLYELILDDKGRAEIDHLWEDLEFVASASLRQYLSFLWGERGEGGGFIKEPQFDPFRPEDKNSASQEMIHRLAELYLAKFKKLTDDPIAIAAQDDYFRQINDRIRWAEQSHVAAESVHVGALVALAQRAYRRPLSAAERDDIAAFYQSLRKEGLDDESAIGDTLASILISPGFCYRVDAAGAGEAIAPLPDYALASRLSYFLWSSMPDEELLAHAAAGDLHRPEVIAAQARRMLRDQRLRGLATEFLGNWLDFRRFEELNTVDRSRFKNFTNELRSAMFEEPIRFFLDVAGHDRSLLDMLFADRTFVNPVLARHYGIDLPQESPDTWVQIDHAGQYGRGGLLPMAVFLTKNAPGLRTSPVKRGYWVVRKLLGERIPPPPPNVPALPPDEAQLGDLTLSQALARHRADRNCASCHAHFDSVGLVFEGYGPTGERRVKDFGGKPIDPHAIFPDGSDGTGLEGLRQYLRQRRQDDFVDNLCRKMLAYALGRSLQLSDEPLIRQMRSSLREDGYRFGGLIESIVISRQFLSRRGQVAVGKR
jgi:hypothetical protein